MGRFKVGVQVQPQHTSMEDFRAAWKAVDRMGVDTIWTWDHFYPLYGDPEGSHFECWSVLAAMAVDTQQAHIGALVACNSYRNPDLLADMARTIDHLSGGRFILGIGAGWFERDYQEYGYEFGTGPSRLPALEESLVRIERRLGKLNPPPLGRMPVMIGGGGEKVTLRITARHADMWNSFGDPAAWGAKNRILTEWCEKVGRDPAEVERTVMIPNREAIARAGDYVKAGAQHILIGVSHPFDLDPVEELLAAVK